ncbi:M20/M25/M40 family metallo-hydrolase [Streptomyces apocyni]|uniref:M20/M25/M40 family metallo-hydrolase n=1 Tax=Streptomyces apocyni TaxID=2654677 RepID=UPI0012EA6CA5|nr:M20/M25/M40 family metallo-hydrolase [Streptomyces apocyni]
MLTKLISRTGVSTLLLVLALGVLGALALLPLRGPAPAAADAAAREFSAERARPVIEKIAAEPRPIGSATGDAARDHLVAKFRELGLEPEVQRATSASDEPGQTAVVGSAENIRATLPGTDGTGRVLLVAHYDSVFTGPGATDDGMGVAALLEVARALKEGPATRNTVEFLLTDGEEIGSLGARVYTESKDAADPRHTVVLNLEARGTHGRVVMFESGAHTGGFVPALAGRPPFATSVSDEIYTLLPNDTDFTVFQDAGYTGMNFAVVGGSAHYDMELDDLAHQRPETLQDMGATVLAATRQLAGQDLAVAGAGDLTWFTLYGLLVRYPTWLGTALAGVTVLGTAGVLWWARRRDAIRGRGVALAAATLPVPLLASAAVGFLGWELLVLIRPHYAGFLFGDPYRPGPAVAGLVVLTAVICLSWLVWMRRGRDATTIAAAVLCWSAALTVLTAAFLPGAGYLFLWPTVFGAAGLACAVRLEDGSAWLPWALAAGAVPAVALFTPLLAVLFPTAGLAFSGAVLVFVALMLLPALPGLRLPVRRTVPVALVTGALLGCLLVGTGGALDGVDERHPAQADLVYVHDADTGEDTWYGGAGSDNDWVGRHVRGERTDVTEEVPGLAQPGGYRKGPAKGGTTPVPVVRVEEGRQSGGVREVRVRLSAEGPTATGLSLYAAPGATQLLDVTVNGQRLSGGTNRPSVQRWTWGCHLVAPSDGPFEVVLRLRGTRKLPLRVLAYAADAPADAFVAPRPKDLAWAPSGFGHSVGMRGVDV